MEINKILSAHILDILFEGKNKDYGAYDLRNTYNKRINMALGITAIIVMILIGAVIRNNTGENIGIIKPNIDVNLSEKRKKDVLPPPPPVPAKPLEVRTIANPTVIIVKDYLVKEPPPEIKELTDARIDIKTNAGEIDMGLIAPVEIKGSKVLEAPAKKENNEDGIFIGPIEIEAKFKGNWNAYLQNEIEKNLEELIDAGEAGTCIVRFVVSKDGSVSNVEAITMKGTKLAEVAVNAIKKGPKWLPAIQNNTQVNAYRQQPVTFKINE